MHSAWFIEELQELILSHCPSSSLSALARTSKWFKEPALNRLWATSTTDISRLLDLMPSDLWADDLETHGVYKVTRKVVPADVSVFNAYAKWVTHLRLSSAMNKGTTESLMRHLPMPIFPKLRSLCSWGRSGTPEYKFIIHSLGPEVNSIQFSKFPYIDSQTALSLFSLISQSYPTLKVFRAGLGKRAAESINITEAIETTISQLDAPVQIEVTNPSPAIIAHIAASRTIRTLTIRDPRQIAIQTLLENGYNRFTYLSKLFLRISHDDGISLIRQLISVIKCDQLCKLSLLMYTEDNTHEQWRMLFREVAQGHSSTMRTLCVYQCYDDTACPLRLVVEPLLNMHNLTVVELNGISVFIEDSDLEELALAWPNLRRLFLSSTEFPAATLAGLARLVQHCPNLESLQFSLNADVTDGLNRFVEKGVCNQRLACLSLTSSTLRTNEWAVADFLFKIVPDLRTINMRGLYHWGSDWHIRWRNVCADISALRSASGAGGQNQSTVLMFNSKFCWCYSYLGIVCNSRISQQMRNCR